MFCYEVLRLQNLTIFEVEFYSNRQLGAAGATALPSSYPYCSKQKPGSKSHIVYRGMSKLGGANRFLFFCLLASVLHRFLFGFWLGLPSYLDSIGAECFVS